MATIDDKVVAMSFESQKFESGVSNTLSAIDKLKAALNFRGAGKGLEDLNNAGHKVDLSHISKGVEEIRGKLGLLSVAALAVFANIAQRAVSAGAQLVKSFTISPILAGFREYSTNLNAVQTILANTQASGATLKDVNAALLDLNKYSDKTIYNFSQMARNIGTFTAAGVDLKTATGSIKGIANLAALSGSSAEQASTAMYQLSQAISSGRVSLQDWNSVVNAGMGGTVFQRALAQTAVAMGKLEGSSLKLVGPMKNVSISGESFRQSIQAGPGKQSWLTSDVLTKTLTQFTGDLSDAKLKADGFNESQIRAIQQTARTAQHAATEVKTISQVFDVAKETAGSGWAQTFQIIFGNFGEAKTTFTALSNAINGFINTNAAARNKVLGDWKALGGRTVLLNSIKTAFHNLGLVLAPIKDAFHDIFPPATGRDLYNLTLRFQDFANAIKPSQETIDNLKRTFRGLFAILDIGKQVIGGIFTVFGQLFGAMGAGSGSFLNFTGSIGDFLVSVDEALKKGNKLHNFFVAIGKALAAPLAVIRTLAGALGDLFGHFSTGGISGSIGGITKVFGPFQKVIEAVSDAWDKFVNQFSNSGISLQGAVQVVIDAISQIAPNIGAAFAGINWETVFAAIRTGLFAGLVLMFKQFLGNGSFIQQITKGLGGVGTGIVANISGTFRALNGSMVAMQNNIKAKTLKEIAIAIALLTASVVALSFIDPEKLTGSITAMGFMFAELLGAMAILDKIGNSTAFIRLPFIAGTLILLGTAIDILTIAVFALSRLSWEELAKGLGGVVVLLGSLSAASIPLSANSAGMVRAGIGITAIAVAMKILASAVQDFGELSWTELTKGLAGVGIGLGIIAAATKVMPKGMILQGAGLIAVAAGLRILADAVTQFASLDWGTMARGLAGVAGSLVIIAGAMHLMPKSTIIMGAGLLVVALSLGKIADAVGTMGGMSIAQIAKGLGTLAGSLLILAVALHAMSGTIGGSFALSSAAAGIALLAPALVLLGKQSWETILRGMVTLAGALTILGLAGVALAPTIPALLGLGVALALIGGGLALAGAGIALIGVGLSAIAVAGPAAVGILVGALTELTEAIPRMATNFALGLLSVVDALAATAPKFVDAIIKIISSLLDAIIRATPKIAEAFGVLLNAAIDFLGQNQGRIIQAGFNLLLALLKGIKNNIGQLVTTVADIIVRFLNGIATNLGRIITAGASILLAIIKGIVGGIAIVALTAVDIVTRFLGAIANNLGKVATAGLNILTRLVSAIASGIGRMISVGADMIVSFVTGIGNAAGRVISAGVSTIIKFIGGIASQSVRLANAAGQAIVDFLNGLTAAVNTYAPQIRSASIGLGAAIIDGMTFGLLSKAQGLYNQAKSIASKALSIIKVPFRLGSPSKETHEIGVNIIQGLINGLGVGAPGVYSAAENMSKGLIQMFKNVFQIQSPSKVMQELGQFVGQGFAQGIRGSKEDINSAFTELNSKLVETMSDAREIIKTEQDKLDKLLKEKKPDSAAIKEAQAAVLENQNILARSTAAHNLLITTLRSEKAELIGLANDYQVVTNKLAAAQDVLANAIKTRNDAIAGFTSQYSTLPSLTDAVDAEGNPVDQLAAYSASLQNQATAVTAYNATLQQLRKLGLDDATYQKLLAEGTADQSFANQLLAGGKTAVEGLNKLDANLQKASTTLAKNAGKNLYQAGVDAAQGLVNGLKTKKRELHDAMTEIADEMLDALRAKLKIKSPSQEFARIGGYAMMGLAQGFSNSTRLVADAIDSAARDALASMRRSMSNLSNVIMDEVNSNLVLTPVLDLTQVQDKVKELADLTSTTPIAIDASLSQAAMISTAQNVSQNEEVSAVPEASSIKFEQNNYSPESLSEIDIYRQTKNQLSQFKTILGVT